MVVVVVDAASGGERRKGREWRRKREASEEEAAVRKARPPWEKEPAPGKSSKAIARLRNVSGGVYAVDEQNMAAVVDYEARKAVNEGR